MRDGVAMYLSKLVVLGVTPQKYPRIFIIKIIIYSGYNWANLGIFLGIVR